MRLRSTLPANRRSELKVWIFETPVGVYREVARCCELPVLNIRWRYVQPLCDGELVPAGHATVLVELA